jgi:hypothetical protein
VKSGKCPVFYQYSEEFCANECDEEPRANSRVAKLSRLINWTGKINNEQGNKLEMCDTSDIKLLQSSLVQYILHFQPCPAYSTKQ